MKKPSEYIKTTNIISDQESKIRKIPNTCSNNYLKLNNILQNIFNINSSVDKNILEYSAKIEPELADKHQIPKYMLKQIMKKKYPLDIIQMDKKGFSFNLENSLKTVLKDEVLALLVERDPYPYNTFNRTELTKYINYYYNNENNNSWGIWVLYALQKWAANFDLS